MMIILVIIIVIIIYIHIYICYVELIYHWNAHPKRFTVPSPCVRQMQIQKPCIWCWSHFRVLKFFSQFWPLTLITGLLVTFKLSHWNCVSMYNAPCMEYLPTSTMEHLGTVSWATNCLNQDVWSLSIPGSVRKVGSQELEHRSLTLPHAARRVSEKKKKKTMTGCFEGFKVSLTHGKTIRINIWRCPEIEVPPNHPFEWDFPLQTIHLGVLPFEEAPI